jgi:hypothetical protein
MGYTNEYWADVAERRAELEREHPEGVWLKSLAKGDPPICSHCPASVAAPLLVDGSHRLANDGDLIRHRAHAADAARRAAARQQLSGRRRDLARLG